MTHKILSAVPRKALAAVFVAITAVLFTLLKLYPNWITALLCLIISGGLCVLGVLHFEWRSLQSITRLTSEIEGLTKNFAEKTYDNLQQEEIPLYETLNQVRGKLDKKGKTKQELLDIVTAVASHTDISKLLRDLLPKINDATRTNCSAFYAVNTSTNTLEIKHSVGFSKNIYTEFDINLGEGMIGYDATKHDITFYDNIPDDTVYYIRTFLGKIKPRAMMVVPILSQDALAGVLVCASIYDYTDEDKSMIELIRHYVGVAVSNSTNFEKTRRLTNELSFQNKLTLEQHEQMKERVEEKNLWLNSLLQYIHRDTAFAVDIRGNVIVCNDDTVARSTAGKPIDKICEENNWPPLSAAVQRAIAAGSCDEPGNGFSFELRAVHNEKKNTLGVLIFIFRR